jgi:2-methylfumaryl-CoA hydratase
VKARSGNFFEDFRLGQVIAHATPRTMSTGDVALYMALYGPRFAVQSSDPFAQAIGYPRAPIDDLLVFHIVFGKSVPDISLNAVANLGYAELIFSAPVFPGDTLTATSKTIGLKENSNRETGVVYLRTIGRNQHGVTVLSYVRWVMVRKRSKLSPAPDPIVPALAPAVHPKDLGRSVPMRSKGFYDPTAAGSPHRFEDYAAGEVIDHIDGMTIEETEHQLATRLYQNTARVHFNQHAEAKGRFGKRLVYGGVVMSIARALSFNGLANAFHIAAINAGNHIAPVFAGDTIYATSKVLEASALPERRDIGALRISLTASACAPEGSNIEASVLALDAWVILPTTA